MEIQTGALIIVLAYMVGMMIIGYVVGKINIKGSADYLVAGRRMGLFMVAFSLSANNIGGGSTTGLAQKAFGAWGISAIWYVLAASLAMIPLAYFAPKIRKTMAVTIPEVVGRRFGKLSSNFTAVLSVLSLFCLTSSQIGASGAVINALIPSIPLNVCLLLAGFVTIFYTTFGGMIADQVSDLIQFGIILVGLAIATPIVLKYAGGWQAISAALPGEKLNMTQIGWASIIGYFFNYFCTFLCGPEMVSRFETCKDEKTAVRASFLCAILMAAMSIFPTLLGLAAFALKDQLPGLAENGSNAMMVVTGAYAPGIITGLISAAIICATMSSADSNLLCMSTMIINDIYPGFGGKKKLEDKQVIFYTRLCNVIAALIAMGISMFGVSLVAMNTFAFGIRCAGPFAANIAGTTRDAIDSYFENESGKFLFIDTAGMRRKSKVDDAVEKYSNLRSIAAIERADVCLILIDANEGVTEQDTKVAGLAHEAGKACIIVVNKWDTVEKDTNTMDEKTAEVRRDLSYMTYAPVVFISALTGQRVDKLFDMIVAVSNQNSMRITTGMLNNILEDATARVQPPTDKGRRLKIYYITQVGVKPPHFVFFCNDSRLFHFSYQRYLENQIRAVFGLTGTPIRITIRQKGDKEDM